MVKFARTFVAIGVAIGVSYAAILYVLFFHTPYADPDDYMAAILDKLERIKQTPSPKVIILGGSNVAFGMDSKRIQSELGMPVVNMGLHANTGLKYAIEGARPYILPGDLVVVIPEYAQFFGIFYGSLELLSAAQLAPQYVNSFQQYLTVLKNGNAFIKKQFRTLVLKQREPLNKIYRRSAFNRHGDVVAHLNAEDKADHSRDTAEQVHKTVRFRYDKTFSNDALSEIVRFSNYVHGKQAKFLLVFPAFRESSFKKKWVPAFTEYDILKKSGLRIYSTPEDYVFPDSYFFDSEYHLNAFGTQARAKKLIAELKRLLSEDSYPVLTEQSSGLALPALSSLAPRANVSAADALHEIQIKASRIMAATPAVQWEGRFEDGWIGKRAKCMISSEKPGKRKVVFTGSVSQYPLPLNLVVHQENKTVKQLRLEQESNFEYELDLDFSSQRKIELEFLADKTFSGKALGITQDPRIFSVMIDAQFYIPRDSLTWEGRFSDGWIGKRAKCIVSSAKPGKKKVVFTGSVSKYVLPLNLVVQRDNKTVKQLRLEQEGNFEFELDLELSPQRRIELEFLADKTFSGKALGITQDPRIFSVMMSAQFKTPEDSLK